MPKNGGSRSKRRARRVAVEQGLRYTEALRRSSIGEHEQGPSEAGASALELVHLSMEAVSAADPADPVAALESASNALSVTAGADRLIEEALLGADGEVYWPGEGFLGEARRQDLDRAVQRLGSSESAGPQQVRDGQARMLTPPDMMPQSYEPVCTDGFVVVDPDSSEQARQLLLFRTQAVAVANQQVWAQVGVLLGQVLAHVREREQRMACRIAALLVEEVLQPGAGGTRGDIERRIVAITVGRRSAAELVADEGLMRSLREAVTAAARGKGWSPMSAVSAALEHADPGWMAQRWGYSTDLKLIAATKQFSIRRLPRKGQQVIEVRARG